MNNNINLTIIIPVYNSEKTIYHLVSELINKLGSKYKLEIILINDKSKDKSDEICVSLYEKYNSIVKYYSLSKNVGEHNAVMAGLNKVTGEYTVIMDDDFQNPVDEVIKIVNFATKHNYDVVYSYYNRKKHSLYRNAGSWFNDKVANFMLKKPKDLYLSSFKVLNKFLVHEIIKYQAPFPYIDGLILQLTDNIGEFQVEHNDRREGRSGYTFGKLIALWSNMLTGFSIIPLRLSTLLGFLFAIIGFLFGIITVMERIINPNLPIGYAALFVAISIFSGVQLIALGMVGEYIGRIFHSLNKRPQFTIRKSFE